MTDNDATPTPRRVLVCGDRNWADRRLVRAFIETLPADATVIQGGARGADTDAAVCAQERGLAHMNFPADWTRLGRAAGPVRNRQMLVEGKPTEVHAFHDDINSSRGTKNMLTQAKAAKVPCWLHTHWCPEGKEYNG